MCVCVCLCVCVSVCVCVCLPVSSLIASSLPMAGLAYGWKKFKNTPYFSQETSTADGGMFESSQQTIK